MARRPRIIHKSAVLDGMAFRLRTSDSEVDSGPPRSSVGRKSGMGRSYGGLYVGSSAFAIWGKGCRATSVVGRIDGMGRSSGGLYVGTPAFGGGEAGPRRTSHARIMVWDGFLHVEGRKPGHGGRRTHGLMVWDGPPAAVCRTSVGRTDSRIYGQGRSSGDWSATGREPAGREGVGGTYELIA